MEKQIIKSFVKLAFERYVKEIGEVSDTCYAFEEAYFNIKFEDFTQFIKYAFGVDYSSMDDGCKEAFIEALQESWVSCFHGYGKPTIEEARKRFEV